MTEKYIAGYAKRLKDIETNLAADENYCVVAQEKLEQLIAEATDTKFQFKALKIDYELIENLYFIVNKAEILLDTVNKKIDKKECGL